MVGESKGEILFVTALGWEARQVLRHLSPPSAVQEGSARLWRGASRSPSISVLQTGVGPTLAARAIRWAAASVRPSVVVVTGCGGALEDGLAVGDVVVADEIVQAGEGAAWPTNRAWSGRYERAAKAASLSTRRGRLYTSATILQSPEDKRGAALRAGAVAVDMETSAIAEWASGAGVELAAARVIVDTTGAFVPPELATITGPDGTPDVRRLIAAFGKRPLLARDLGLLGIATMRCAKALGALHGALLAELRAGP